MNIDKTKLKDGLKTAANVGLNLANAGSNFALAAAPVAAAAVPVIGSVVNTGLGLASQLINKIGGGKKEAAPEFTPSDTVTNLGNQLGSLKAPVQQPSQYNDMLQQTMNAILNKKDFSYDVNADALYQQYKDQYVLGGKNAMQDTMGQAAALTGGYGNSYAQAVGQQQYQAYLQQLNDRIPELYQLARDSYDRDTDKLYRQFGLLSDVDDKEYSRYRDQVADFYANRDYLTNRYYNERNFEYGQHRDNIADSQWQQTFDRGVYEDNRDFMYGMGRDAVSDLQWATSFGRDIYENNRDYAYKVGRDAVSDSNWQQEFDLALNKYNDTKNKNSTGSSSGSGSNNNNGGTPIIDNNGGGKPDDVPLPGNKKGWFDYDEATHNKEVEKNKGSYYSTAKSDIRQMANAGKSSKEVQDYLLELVGNSLLSRSEYLSLYNAFRDKKL